MKKARMKKSALLGCIISKIFYIHRLPYFEM